MLAMGKTSIDVAKNRTSQSQRPVTSSLQLKGWGHNLLTSYSVPIGCSRQMPMSTDTVQRFITRWHEIFAKQNPTLMLELMHDDIEFFSPAIFQPKRGKEEVFELLCTVFDVINNYHVTNTWVQGREVLFEFEADVEKFRLQGIDRFRLNDEGKVVQMKVWIRPLTGLNTLARVVSQRGLQEKLAHKGRIEQALTLSRVRAQRLARALMDSIK